MTYAFARNEGVEAGARRIAREVTWYAIGALEGQTGDEPEEQVHEARKALKRLRALVRLVRGAVGRETAEHVDRVARDVGRALSGSRDAAVVVQTFDALGVDAEAAAPVRASLVRARGSARRKEHAHRTEALTALHAFAPSIQSWPFEGSGWAALEPGARAIYRAARRELAAVHASATPERIHELRKRTKDLHYHAQLLRELWPEAMTAYVRALHDLGDLLGEEHDLVVLRELLVERGARGLAVDPFIERIDAKRAALIERILPLADRLLAEKPGGYARRLGGWFSAW